MQTLRAHYRSVDQLQIRIWSLSTECIKQFDKTKCLKSEVLFQNLLKFVPVSSPGRSFYFVWWPQRHSSYCRLSKLWNRWPRDLQLRRLLEKGPQTSLCWLLRFGCRWRVVSERSSVLWRFAWLHLSHAKVPNHFGGSRKRWKHLEECEHISGLVQVRTLAGKQQLWHFCCNKCSSLLFLYYLNNY